MDEAVFRVLTVCTMNICRSPALAVVLRRRASCLSLPAGSIDVQSAGTHAIAGAPSCDISLDMVGEPNRDLLSRELSETDLVDVDLVITAARSHLSVVVALRPGLRPVCFTARQAGRLATWVVQSGALDVGQQKAAGAEVVINREVPATLAEPLPLGTLARLRWLVTEMDAARGLAPIGHDEVGLSADDVDDIPDPHVVGFEEHRLSADLVLASMGLLARAAAHVLDC